MDTKGEGGHIGFSAGPVGVCVDIPLVITTISLEPMGGVSCMDIPLERAQELIRVY